MKKFALSSFPLLLVSSIAFLGGCSENYDEYLTVYNWEDYIYAGTDDDGNIVADGTVRQFEKYYEEKTGKTIKVNYVRFSTNEEMYQKLTLGRIKADLICPSDYMIQKMANAGLLEPFSYNEEADTYAESLSNWDLYGSPYIRDRFAKEKLDDGSSFLKYAVPYFWGTMGFTYNPEYFNEEEITTWECLWSKDARFAKKLTLKDSIRDTYVAAIFHVYKDEIAALDVNSPTYNKELSDIFNRHDDATLALVKAALIEAKKSTVYAFEVDEGKNGIVTGEYEANLAWSGDSVYSMDEAEEGGKYLNYALPKEGSNVWFDGWCMPKGAQKELAEEFVNFISKPSVAVECMEEVGYTSPIVGDEILEYVEETYAAEEGETDTYQVDLSFFFGDNVVLDIPNKDKGRQFDAQYPTEEMLKRCCMMKDFGKDIDKVDQMWKEVKA